MNLPHRRLSLVLALLLLIVPALLPLLRRDLTCGFDNVFHLWRAVEMGALLQEGVLFTRWAPHMAQGYGYPLFLYQSPLSATVAALFNLTGLSWALALNATYAVGMVGTAGAAWWLARDLWGERAGIVTAVALTFAPYHLYVVYYRASLSETVAWVFPPLVLWGLRRWQVARQGIGLATAVLALMLLFLTHDVTAYLFFPFFVAWVVGIGAQQRRWRAVRDGLLGLALSAAAGALFWLPAIGARNLIQFDRASSAWPFLPQNNFLPLDQLLALPRLANPAWLNEWPSRGLGALLLVLALAGLWLGWRRGGMQRWETAVLGLVLAGYLFLITPLSRPLWLYVDLLTAFQFPWRFLSPAVLAAALLAGAVVSSPAPSKAHRFPPLLRLKGSLPLILIALLSLLHWGWLSPAYCAPPADTSLAGMVQWERDTGTLGTTASRELLPVTVGRLPQEPDAPPPWQARLLPQELPPGAAVLAAKYQPLKAAITLETPIAFTARYRAFAFPGWRVTVNGAPAAITPTEPEGLISFPVPPGRVDIEVAFGSTPLRVLGSVLTLLALALMGVLAWRARPLPGAAPAIHPHTWGVDYRALLLLAGLLLLGRWVTLGLGHNGRFPNPAVSQSLTFGVAGNAAQVRLLGHDELPQTLAADQPLALTLVWQALLPLDRSYRVGLMLLDGDGRRLSAIDLRDDRWSRTPPPTQAWPVDRFVTTSVYVDVLPGTPPAPVTLTLTFFDAETLAPLTAFTAAGQSLGPAVTLGEILLTAPRAPWSVADLGLAHSFTLATAQGAILGADVARRQAAPGDPLPITLAWSPQGTAVLADLLLLDAAGQAIPISQVTLPDVGEGVWRQEIDVQLPVTLADDVYTWALRSREAQVAWGDLTIQSPPRLFAPPPFMTAVAETLGNQVTLVGYSLPTLQAGSANELTLIWRGEAVMTTGYRVFVHLVGEDGRLLAQSDGMPAQWTRPTTGWLPGEYVSDSHTLTPPDAPPGAYQLRVGLYGPDGTRLLTAAGADAISLPVTLGSGSVK